MINAPSNLTATAISYSEIALSWTDNANNNDGFEIWRSINDNLNYILIATVGDVTSYTDSGLSPFTTYYYRVRAMGSDYSDYSNEAQARTVVSWTSVAAGYYHSLALTSNGTLFSWGWNVLGQLGLGDWDTRMFPNLITSDWDGNPFDNIKAVVVNKRDSGYTLALKNDGTIWGWGANGLGQLGLGATWTPEAPVRIGSDSNWFVLTAGWAYSVGLKANPSGGGGTLWSWGTNASGELGLGDTISRTIPTLVTTETDWSIISAGNEHTLALKTNGRLWAWGRNWAGQLGLGDNIDRNTPTLVSTETDWSMLSTGFAHNVVLKTNLPDGQAGGRLWAWGSNNYGQLGLGDTGINRTTPTQIGSGTDWSSIAVSLAGNHTIARKNNGTLWAWGSNSAGQLGLGDTIDRRTPTLVSIDTDWSIFSAGTFHSLGIKINGTLWGWGGNTMGQLGLGDTINRNLPTLVGE